MSRIERIGLATPKPWVRIYALCEPDWTVRYVGKTVQWLDERHKAHIRAAKAGKRLPVHYWLRKQMDRGAMLAISLLENVADGADWQVRERHWIALYRSQGANLLNLAGGGEGLHGHRFTDDHRAKIAASLRTGAHIACEVCGASAWRKANEIAKGHGRFCSRQCSNTRHKGAPLHHGA